MLVKEEFTSVLCLPYEEAMSSVLCHDVLY